MESPNLEFEYGDTDALTAELSGTADRHKQHSHEHITAMEECIIN